MFGLLKRQRELIVVGALLLYPFGTYLARGHKGRDPNFVDRVVLWVTSPLSRALIWACDGVGEGVSGYVALRGVRQQNAGLSTENSQLRAEVNSLREQAAENERLRRAVGYVEASAQQEIAARIIGVNPVSTFLSLRLDRGEDDGVHAGMPVVTADGILGRVKRATGGYSDVQLVTDQTSKVAVLVQRSRVRATASGAGGGHPLSLDNVLRTDDVEEGDLIITSGTDGVFPKGLVVGRVTAVERKSSGMLLSAGILAAVDVSRLEEVLVVPALVPTQLPSARAGEGGR
ncbi:MAG: rod shape-determining protein MreC [Myxococcaceae bacterium]